MISQNKTEDYACEIVLLQLFPFVYKNALPSQDVNMYILIICHHIITELLLSLV